MRATRLGRYNGKNVYRFPVERSLIDGTLFSPQTKLPTIHVVANTAADAANYALEETLRETQAECEVTAFGPRGGKAHRYAQTFGVIAFGIGGGFRPHSKQLALPVPSLGIKRSEPKSAISWYQPTNFCGGFTS